MNYADAPDEIIVPEEALAAPVEGPVPFRICPPEPSTGTSMRKAHCVIDFCAAYSDEKAGGMYK